MTEPPTTAPNDPPALVLDRAGRWLADELGDATWTKTRQQVRRRTGTRAVLITLQPSTWNRAGIMTRASVRLTVTDTVHREWLRREGLPHEHATVYSSLLINIHRGLSDVECSGLPQSPENDAPGLTELLHGLRTTLLPTCDLFEDPARAAAGLPEAWVGMVDEGTVGWALAHGDQAAARLLVRRCVERPLKGLQTWDTRLAAFSTGFGSPDRPSLGGGLDALGWVSRRHGLLDPADLRAPEKA